MLAPNVLSVRHWDRLLGGLLYAASPRVDWATLLRRSFAVDVMECARCHGRLRVLAVITERDTARRLLTHLGMPTARPRAAITPPRRASGRYLRGMHPDIEQDIVTITRNLAGARACAAERDHGGAVWLADLGRLHIDGLASRGVTSPALITMRVELEAIQVRAAAALR